MTGARLLVLVLLVPLAAGAWPSFHGDERNTGLSAANFDLPLREAWAVEGTGSHAEASPVSDGNVVVVADWAGNVRALSVESGAEKWSIKMDRIVGTPAIDGGRLFVVDRSGTLVAYDLAGGGALASAQVGRTLASPTIHEGKLFLGNEAGVMAAYDTQSLTKLWSFSVSDVHDTATLSGSDPNDEDDWVCSSAHPPGEIRGAAAVYKGQVIFGSLNHYVYAVHEEGTPDKSTYLLWAYRTGDIVWSSPAIDHGRNQVVVGSYDETLYSFRADPGTPNAGERACGGVRTPPVWEYDVPSGIGLSKIHSSPATDGSHVYFGANNGRIYAVRPGGHQVWQAEAGDDVISSPALFAGHLAVGADDGKLYVLTRNGATAQVFDVGGPVKASPAIVADGIIIVDFDGRVVKYGPAPPPMADLTAAVVLDGERFRISVRNDGDADAGPSRAKLLLDDVALATLEVPALAAGEATSLFHTAAVAVGQTLRVQVDADQQIAERDEANNWAAYSPPAPTATPTPPPSEGLPAQAWLVITALAVALSRKR